MLHLAADITTAVLGLVLIWTGLAKVARSPSFELAIRSWGIRNDALHALARRLFPIVEIGVGGAVISAACLGAYLQLTGIALSAGFALLVFGQLLIRTRSRAAWCGCSGTESPIGTHSLGRAAGATVAALAILVVRLA